ncbi:MAG: hypothetical protein LUE90_06230 [Clostridiales bacterium]|nr:hypothetical protein [Clostridiales bacterium]
MREWKIVCDKCGKEITGNPIILCADRTDRTNKEISVDTICEGIELCDQCWKDISDAIMVNLLIRINSDATPESAPETEAAPEVLPEEQVTEEVPPESV